MVDGDSCGGDNDGQMHGLTDVDDNGYSYHDDVVTKVPLAASISNQLFPCAGYRGSSWC